MQITTKHVLGEFERFEVGAFYQALDKQISVILPNGEETIGKLLDATVVDDGRAVDLTIELDDSLIVLFTSPFN